jgi:death on curing protein
MAAAYAFHLAENQPFIDGNKADGPRCRLRVSRSEWLPFAGDWERLYQAMMAVAAHELDKAGLAEVFRQMATPENQ